MTSRACATQRDEVDLFLVGQLPHPDFGHVQVLQLGAGAVELEQVIAAGGVDDRAGELLRILARQHLEGAGAHQAIDSQGGRRAGLDQQVRGPLPDRKLQQLVDQQGRNAVLYAEPDEEGRRQALQYYGVQPAPRARQSADVPAHEQREAALDALLAHGITPVFDQLAATADKVAVRIDMRTNHTTTVAQDGDWWQGFCQVAYDAHEQENSRLRQKGAFKPSPHLTKLVTLDLP